MKQEIHLSGTSNAFLDEKLISHLKKSKPKSIGVASAFVSTSGLKRLEEIVKLCNISTCRIIAGLDNAITHPTALQRAIDNGWELRLGQGSNGIFHPKLFIGGKKFDRQGTLQDINFLYVGSSNLTLGGFRKNIECGFLENGANITTTAATAFAQLWSLSSKATEHEIKNYGALFAEVSRKRSILELVDLGVNDEYPNVDSERDLYQSKKPATSALNFEFSVAAWAGLQSFTGDYRFQVEFPNNAGRVISQLVRHGKNNSEHIDVFCPDDGKTRKMQYKFYAQNGMFRLNIQNDVPGVEWARTNKDGIAIVERGLPGGATIAIRILRPGAEANEIAKRSALLGTWGKTTTRAYGWF
jgi:HKD family nuclease